MAIEAEQIQSLKIQSEWDEIHKLNAQRTTLVDKIQKLVNNYQLKWGSDPLEKLKKLSL
jgi:hypothetical protein